jgi:hypothetical protein
LSGKSYASLAFKNSLSLIEESRMTCEYVYIVDLKIDFSVFSIEESAKRLDLFNDPAFSDFKICIENKTFHVIQLIFNKFARISGLEKHNRNQFRDSQVKNLRIDR